MRISDWSSDVCSSDLHANGAQPNLRPWRWRALETTELEHDPNERHYGDLVKYGHCLSAVRAAYRPVARSEEHTSELQSLMRIWYAVFCLKKKIMSLNKIQIGLFYIDSISKNIEVIRFNLSQRL